MNTLNEIEMFDVTGGVSGGLIGAGLTAYIGLLNKMEQNPQDYTWLMDWYYER